MANPSKQDFLALVARARANAEAAKQAAEVAGIAAIGQQAAKADTIDTSLLGITNESLKTDVGQDTAIDIIRDIASNISTGVSLGQSLGEDTEQNADVGSRTIGVARRVVLNQLQEAFNQAVQTGQDVVLVGAAGTGKTTCMRKVTEDLMDSGRIRNIKNPTKWLLAGSPGAAILSYTRKATNNIRHAVTEKLKSNTLTIHKILEFAPIYYQIEDPNNPGDFKTTMRFEPKRNAENPLPSDLVFVGFEESSMVEVPLHQMLRDAIPHECQFIYLGDIQQLPPVFGLSILGFKMLELPVVELKEVYRQALNSPIISLAWKLLEGNPHVFDPTTETYKTHSAVFNKEVSRIRVPALESFNASTSDGTVQFQVWQKKLSSDDALFTAVKQFCAWADSDYFNTKEDIILCPYNKALGTTELNKGISQHLGSRRGAIVHEVIAGFNKHYLAIGDRVLYDKEDAFIVDIVRNDEYLGKSPQLASKNLDRWGHYREAATNSEVRQHLEQEEGMTEEALEKFMQSAVSEEEDRVNAASHVVTIRLAFGDGELDQDIELSSASEINNLLGGYAITVHKAQGSEWEKVFLLMHNSHAVMNQRELLYTAVTRARNYLHIICEPETFFKGCKSQRIKGNTIAEKAEYFKGKQTQQEIDANKVQLIAGAVTATTTIKGKPAIKLAELVPPSIRIQALMNLQATWAAAIKKFAYAGDIGETPKLTFDIASKKTVGRAFMGARWEIQLNPVWLACGDAEVVEQMLSETIIHEVCHCIAYKLFADRGHGAKWKFCMMRMGIDANRLYTQPLPPWAEVKKELLSRVLLDGYEAVNDNDESETEE